MHNGKRTESLIYGKVPNLMETEHHIRQNIYHKTEFAERGHNFQRSQSLAKYHGSHIRSRTPRIHRRSRSDLSGFVLTPPHSTEIPASVASRDSLLGRSEIQILLPVSLTSCVVVIIHAIVRMSYTMC